MILSDRHIRDQINQGSLTILSLGGVDAIQPASVDLRLDDTLLLDDLPIKLPYLLEPGEFVLGSTVEWIGLPADLAARVEGKSSLGRRGLRQRLRALGRRPSSTTATHAGRMTPPAAADHDAPVGRPRSSRPASVATTIARTSIGPSGSFRRSIERTARTRPSRSSGFHHLAMMSSAPAGRPPACTSSPSLPAREIRPRASRNSSPS